MQKNLFQVDKSKTFFFYNFWNFSKILDSYHQTSPAISSQDDIDVECTNVAFQAEPSTGGYIYNACLYTKFSYVQLKCCCVQSNIHCIWYPWQISLIFFQHSRTKFCTIWHAAIMIKFTMSVENGFEWKKHVFQPVFFAHITGFEGPGAKVIAPSIFRWPPLPKPKCGSL